ncbi:MAG: hypothetical protein COU71_02990 [Parcubacteria group bacterium CG10_big_fil_rev_8_21_14_0_10_38_31]|nr:MAG: hypothetical protein COU71_02990 [Parcubacteria group bacterium CG10_big_fil_rev_8_21_14_0_10_38_31]
MSENKLVSRIREIVMTKEEFMNGAKPSSLFKEVNDEIATDIILIDESKHRRDLDFSILANQSVTNPRY